MQYQVQRRKGRCDGEEMAMPMVVVLIAAEMDPVRAENEMKDCCDRGLSF